MKTTFTCPVCGITASRVHTVNKPPKFCSRACANQAPGRMTDEVRQKIGAAVTAESHPNWLSGSWKTKTGRTFIRVPPDERHLHPTIRKDGYIARWHYVWNLNHPEDPMTDGWILHHKNHDKTDDRIENLEKLTQSEHARLHFLGTRATPEARANMSAAQLARRARERASA